jgi:glycosyltransferase involved in cell wall biosynthesis
MTTQALFLTHEASRTGAPIMLLNLQRWLRRHESISFRTVTGSPGALSSEFAMLGKVHSLEPGDPLYRAMRRLDLHHSLRSHHLARLREDLAKERFALVYVNSVASGRLLDQLPVGDCEVICHVHELAGAIRSVGLENLEALERRRARYLAVSDAVKTCLVEEFNLAPARIEVIEPFIPDSEGDSLDALKARRKLARELGISPETRIVCGCGSIEARKGVDLFLEVARRVVDRAEERNVQFLWVGGAPDKVETMRREVETLRLSSHVRFIGRKADVNAYFAASEAFLLTSREEAFGLVVLEAARCGTPTICFDASDAARRFVEPDAGFSVANFDVGEMSERVLQTLSSRSLRDQMGRAAKRKVEARHTPEQGARTLASRVAEAVRRGSRWSSDRGPAPNAQEMRVE